VRHLYLGLPIGRAELERLLGSLPNLIYLDLLLVGDDAAPALALSPHLRTLRLRRTWDSSGQAAALPELTVLRSLEMARWGPVAAGILERVPQLERLYLEHASLAGEDIRALATMPALSQLALRAAQVDASVLRAVASCADLQTLDIANNSLSSKDTAQLGQLGQLRELNLSGNAVDIGLLAALPLRRLWLDNVRLTLDTARDLMHFAQLIELDITNNNLGAEAGPILAELTALRALYADGNRLGQGARHLGALQALETLQLSSNGMTGCDIPDLGGLTALRSLDLSTNYVGLDSIQALAYHTEPREVNIFNTNIFSSHARAIAAVASLRRLDLSSNGIGDAGAEALAEHRGLVDLNVGHNGIGYRRAIALAKMAGLRRLGIANNRVPDAAAAALIANPSISWLDLADNNIQEPRGMVVDLSRVFLHGNPASSGGGDHPRFRGATMAEIAVAFDGVPPP